MAGELGADCALPFRSIVAVASPRLSVFARQLEAQEIATDVIFNGEKPCSWRIAYRPRRAGNTGRRQTCSLSFASIAWR